MNEAFLNLLADAGAAAITHIGLVDDVGDEVGDGRKAVTWTAADDGLIRPTADLVFDMVAEDNVSGWRGYSASTEGTDFGGAALPSTDFANDGTFTLLAASTGIDVDAS